MEVQKRIVLKIKGMTIERTRQLLGKKVAHLSDNEVLLLIQQTDNALDFIFKFSIQNKRRIIYNENNS